MIGPWLNSSNVISHCLHISCFPLSCSGLNLMGSAICKTKDPAQTLQCQVISPIQRFGISYSRKSLLLITCTISVRFTSENVGFRLVISWTLEKRFWLPRYKCYICSKFFNGSCFSHVELTCVAIIFWTCLEFRLHTAGLHHEHTAFS